jgi:hypothetical protein
MYLGRSRASLSAWALAIRLFRSSSLIGKVRNRWGKSPALRAAKAPKTVKKPRFRRARSYMGASESRQANVTTILVGNTLKRIAYFESY